MKPMLISIRELINRAAAKLCAMIVMIYPVYAQAQAQSFEACVAGLRQTALSQGISQATFTQAMADLTPDPEVLKSYEYQPEFTTPIWDYVSGLVDEERIKDGRERLAEWSSVLGKIEQEYGVDRNAVVAVWGVESNFGRIQGKKELLRSLTTLVCADKRQTFFRGELMATLKILQTGDIPPAALLGSWAGAFGQTQFMPTTFQRLAIDFDGDGKRDIVNSVPDALASTANFLHRGGWVTGEPWGYEVKLPPNYSGPSGRRNRQPLSKWTSLGIRRLEPAARASNHTSVKQVPADTTQAALLLPTGPEGPAFLVFKNFDVIYGYNASESYALSIAHLADRLAGAAAFQTPWPTDDPGTSRVQRREIQERLLERGYDVGIADGLIGEKSRSAIRAFQASAGMAADGRAGQRVLSALRAPISGNATKPVE